MTSMSSYQEFIEAPEPQPEKPTQSSISIQADERANLKHQRRVSQSLKSLKQCLYDARDQRMRERDNHI